MTGIDLAPGMLAALRARFPEQELTLIQGSYFDVPLGTAQFNAAVSVESLHHFTAAEKLPLYRRLRDALVPGGYFILTDYFAASDEEERALRAELLRQRAEEGIPEGEFCHFDTPLTLAHELETLEAAGFRTRVLRTWSATTTIRADRA